MSWAALHLAWQYKEQSSRFIFGWLENFSHYVPKQTESIVFSYNYLNYGYFPISFEESENWFENARAGKILLPPFSEMTGWQGVASFSPSISIYKSGLEASELPFLSFVHAPVSAEILHGELESILNVDLAQRENANWLTQKLRLNLEENVELFGSVVRTFYDKEIREVQTRLVPGESNDVQIVRIIRWPVKSQSKFTLHAYNMHEEAELQKFTVDIKDEIVLLRWKGKTKRITLEIYDEYKNLRWQSQPGYFIR